jgi:hypothetical protein
LPGHPAKCRSPCVAAACMAGTVHVAQPAHSSTESAVPRSGIALTVDIQHHS